MLKNLKIKKEMLVDQRGGTMATPLSGVKRVYTVVYTADFVSDLSGFQTWCHQSGLVGLY